MRQIAVLRPALSWLLAPSLLIVLTIAALPSAVAAPRSVAASRGRSGAVYTMTNAAGGNEVIAYRRSTDGSLDEFGRYATGGEGTGRTRLSSQGPVTLSEDGRWLFVANVGSDEISVFAVRRNKLRLVDVRPSGGRDPYSITVYGDLVYVLNNAGGGNITGFRVRPQGRLDALSGSTRPLSGAAVTDPAQVAFTPDGRSLVVTEKATDIIDIYSVDGSGLTRGPRSVDVSDPDGTPVTPFGGDFTSRGQFIVTEAAAGEIGEAATSSYAVTRRSRLTTISDSVRDTRSEVCWTVVTPGDGYAFVTNFGDGTLSSYQVATDGSITLLDAVAAVTSPGELSVRDHGLSEDGRFLYAIDIHSQMVHGWRVGADGGLTEIGAFPGLPPTVAGLAAS
jgi:6-phosphogluconolactonase (cycloisomerase 2 family)